MTKLNLKTEAKFFATVAAGAGVATWIGFTSVVNLFGNVPYVPVLSDITPVSANSVVEGNHLTTHGDVIRSQERAQEIVEEVVAHSAPVTPVYEERQAPPVVPTIPNGFDNTCTMNGEDQPCQVYHDSDGSISVELLNGSTNVFQMSGSNEYVDSYGTTWYDYSMHGVTILTNGHADSLSIQ